MTTPNSANPTVAENNHLSTCSLYGICKIFDCRFLICDFTFRRDVFQSKLANLKSQILDLIFEYPSPVLETLEHVKAGASRREQNNIAAFGRRERSRHGIVHVGGVLKRR